MGMGRKVAWWVENSERNSKSGSTRMRSVCGVDPPHKGSGKVAEPSSSSNIVSNAPSFWGERYGTILTNTQIVAINRNLLGFFKVLQKWQKQDTITKNEQS